MTDSDHRDEPYTISTPDGDQVLCHVGDPSPHPTYADMLQARLTLEGDSLLLAYPANADVTVGAKGEETILASPAILLSGVRIREITDHTDFSGVGCPPLPQSCGQVVFTNGAAFRYAYLLRTHHTVEEKLLAKQLAQSHTEKEPEWLTIRGAAEYANVTERTIRHWREDLQGDKPMLPNTIQSGRKIRIKKTDLDPWRQTAKATRKSTKRPRKRPAKKTVKRKS